MNKRHPAHCMRGNINIGSLACDTDHVGKIQKIIIVGVLGSRKNQTAALGRRSARFGEIFIEIFMRIMEGVGQMNEEPSADDRRRREPNMQPLMRPG